MTGTAASAPKVVEGTAISLSIGIAADDLTGAGDSAVQFAALGWDARLTLSDADAAGIARVTPGSVLAVVTDARALLPEAARISTSGAVAALMGAGIDRLFVKIDSTMRGSVAAQVRGAIETWSGKHPDAIAVVCPAYPAMGRTVEHGRLLVDGQGVETTAIGRDPVTPVVTSALADLLAGSIAIIIGRADAPELADRIIARSAEANINTVAVDAVTTADLEVLATAIGLLGGRAVAVGSAGLAEQLSRVWAAERAGRRADVSAVPSPEIGPVVVVVSSLHNVSRSQHAHLLQSQHRVLTIAPTLAEILHDSPHESDDHIRRWVEAEIEAAASASVVVILSPAERVKDSDPVRVAAALAAITDTVVSRLGASSLVLMGGEGARAVLGRFAADSVIITRAIGEGTPLGVIDGGRLHGRPVVTKAGGFGSESALTDLIPELVERFFQGASK